MDLAATHRPGAPEAREEWWLRWCECAEASLLHASDGDGGRGKVQLGRTRHQTPSQWAGQQLTSHERGVRKLLGLARQVLADSGTPLGHRRSVAARRRFAELAEGTVWEGEVTQDMLGGLRKELDACIKSKGEERIRDWKARMVAAKATRVAFDHTAEVSRAWGGGAVVEKD
eukprot:15477206-Alexandrium_andersonii.AAC.1